MSVEATAGTLEGPAEVEPQTSARTREGKCWLVVSGDRWLELWRLMMRMLSGALGERLEGSRSVAALGWQDVRVDWPTG